MTAPLACCLAHRREVAWMPAPGWWVHPGSQSCHSMRDAPSPVLGIRLLASRGKVTREVALWRRSR